MFPKFDLSEKFRLPRENVVDRPNPKKIIMVDFRYTPRAKHFANRDNPQNYIGIPKEDSSISLKDSNLNFESSMSREACFHAL